MQRMYVVPRYDPVFVEPNLKEYETQVCFINYRCLSKRCLIGTNITSHTTRIFCGYPLPMLTLSRMYHAHACYEITNIR